MSDRGPANAPIRHIPYTNAPGTAPLGVFSGHHYIVQDRERFPVLAEQSDIRIHWEGDKTLPRDDPFSYEPHVEVRVFIGGQWETRSRTMIGK